MTRTLAEFETLRDAEEYFTFFGLDYDPQVVNVNRLHILRKFSQAIKTISASSESLSETEILTQYQQALQDAYTLFLTSNSIEQKLFGVFQRPHDDVVMLDDIAVTSE